jgi:hypothetical protein
MKNNVRTNIQQRVDANKRRIEEAREREEREAAAIRELNQEQAENQKEQGK